MKTALSLIALLLVAQGCKPEKQPSSPPTPPPAAPSSAATAPASPSDERALQTLRDLGVSPEMMLQLVRNQLAAPVGTAIPGQPPPASIGEPAAPEAPAVAQNPVPAPLIPAPTTPTPAPEPPAVAATPPPVPAAEWPNAPAANQPEPVADAGTGNLPQPAPAPNVVVVQQPVVIQQTQDFYAPLNNYGAWVDLPNYGRVWQPTVTVVIDSWRPYCQGGHWVYTDCGWYWQSDYSWGWAPFHYGRWCYVDRYRWVWVPDTVWAPAWVSWRRSDTHCGWAPLPPGTGFRVGVGFTFGHDNQYDVHFGISSGHYTFVPTSRFCDRNLATVVVTSDHVNAVYQSSTYVSDSHTWNNTDRRVHNEGPGREWSALVAHQPTPRPLRVVAAPVAPLAPAAPPTHGRTALPNPPTMVHAERPVAPADPTHRTDFTPGVPVTEPRDPGSHHDTRPPTVRTPVVTPEPVVVPTMPATPAAPSVNLTPKPVAPVKWHAPVPPQVERPATPVPVEPAMPEVHSPTAPRHEMREPKVEPAVPVIPPVSAKPVVQTDSFANRDRIPVTHAPETRDRIPTPVVTHDAPAPVVAPVVTRDVPPPVVPVTRTVLQPVAPVTVEPTATHDMRSVDPRRETREPRAEPVAPTMPHRVDTPAPTMVVTPRADASDKSATRPGPDGTRLDGEDDRRPFKR